MLLGLYYDMREVQCDSMNQQFVITLVLLLSASLMSWVPGGALAVSVFISPGKDANILLVEQYLNVSDAYLVMQPDCDVILYNSSQPVLNSATWRSGSSTILNCSLRMQGDGNLVIYNTPNHTDVATSNAIWSTNTWTQNAIVYNYLILKADGSYGFYAYNGYLNSSILQTQPALDLYSAPNVTVNVTTYPFSPQLAWKPETSLVDFPYMPAEYFISEGYQLRATGHKYVLHLGNNCNLQSKTTYGDGSTVTIIWETGTNSTENRDCRLLLQRNGRLQLRGNNTGLVYWNSSDVVGDETVNWVLILSPEDGSLSVRDFLNYSTVLWNNTNLMTTTLQTTGTITSKTSIVWKVVLGVVGGALVLAMATLVLYFYVLQPTFLDPAEKDFRHRLQISGGKSKALSPAKIKQATNNFSHVLGQGGFGDVFYGKLASGQEIAAKVLSTNSHQSKEEFFNEIELLSTVHHKYLVSLLGYSCTHKHQVLIYEYLGGGDLRHRLQGESVAVNPLNWRQRTTIAHQVAEGLEYLHDKCSPSIIHRDVKSTNILLTNNLVAKVADFGLSKLRAIGQEEATHITTVVKGTPGYLDPEYHETGLLTDKSDVYAFGIVLMEILTGLNPMKIAHRVREAWRSEQLDDLADPNLEKDFDKGEFVNLVKLALWCARISSMERPFMHQVVQRLRQLGLVPVELNEPSGLDLGEEGHYIPAFNIVTSMDYDILPLTESSSSGLSSDSQFRSNNLRSR